MSKPYDTFIASKDLDDLDAVYTKFCNKISNGINKKTPNRLFPDNPPQRDEMLYWHDMLILEDQLEKLDSIKKKYFEDARSFLEILIKCENSGLDINLLKNLGYKNLSFENQKNIENLKEKLVSLKNSTESFKEKFVEVQNLALKFGILKEQSVIPKMIDAVINFIFSKLFIVKSTLNGQIFKNVDLVKSRLAYGSYFGHRKPEHLKILDFIKGKSLDYQSEHDLESAISTPSPKK